MSVRVFTTVVLSYLVAQAFAETHTVTFHNNCGTGTPKLVQAGHILNNGNTYTHNGPITSAIAYLDNGKCLLNGEGCTLIELNLQNGGNGANSADISLIPPHALNVPAGFKFTGSGASCGGASCGDARCKTAFFVPDDTCVQVGCEANDVGLDITFCGVGTSFTAPNHPGSPCH